MARDGDPVFGAICVFAVLAVVLYIGVPSLLTWLGY